MIVTIFTPDGKISMFHEDVHFKPSPALTEVSFDGVRHYYNTDGELIATVEND